MSNFFSYILKQKNILIFLFLIAGVLIIPQVSRAASLGDVLGGSLSGGISWDMLKGFFGGAVPSSAAFGFATGLTGGQVFLAVLKALTRFLLDIIQGIAIFLGGLFSDSFTKIIYWNVTNYSAFLNGWTTVRDLANILIVLGFVVVGIAFTLRLEGYGSKKVLISLILVALLINFSNVISGIIIDASNITMRCFVEGKCSISSTGNALSAGIATDHILPAIKTFTDANLKSETIKSDFNYTQAASFCILMYIVVIVVFVYMLFVLFERYVMIGILYMLAPLAFFAYVFPATKKYFTRWWEEFLKWAFVGVGAAFFLWLAQQILSAPGVRKVDSANNVTIDTFSLFLVLILLFISYKTIKKSSIFANAVISLAKTAAGVAIGAGLTAATAGGAFALKSMGATRVAANIKDTMTGGLERLGLVSKGTTASSQKKRLDEAKKRLENITDNKRLAEIAEQRAITHRQSLDKAAAADILAGRNAFGAVDASKRDAVAAHAAAFGVPKETFTKVRPETFAIAEHTEAVEKATIEQAKIHSAMTGQSMEKSLKTLKATNWKPSDDELRNAKIALEQRKITENALGISPVSDKDVTSRLIEEEQKAAIDAGATRAEAIEQTKNFVPNAGQIADAKDRIAQERIRKAVSKLSSAKIPDLPLEAINAQTIGAFSENQLKEGIARRGSGALLEKARKYGDPNTPEGKEFAAIRASTSDPLEQQRLADVFNILQTL